MMRQSNYNLTNSPGQSISVGLLAFISSFLVFSGAVRAQSQLAADDNDALTIFLKQYAEDPNFSSSQYTSAFVDLNEDGVKEVIVYLTSNDWCGSGGCTTLILTPQGPSYKVITKITITRLPIRVLNSKTNGWHDLAVQVAGGGISGYEAGLLFDGTSYPSNPSVPPAKRLNTKAQGKIAIPVLSETKTKS